MLKKYFFLLPFKIFLETHVLVEAKKWISPIFQKRRKILEAFLRQRTAFKPRLSKVMKGFSQAA